MKKYTAVFFLAGLLGLLMFTQCKKDERKINLNLTAVPTLFTPDDALMVKLNPAANLTETFEWEQARAEDGSLVLYEVAFDQADGDFSAPFYTVLSDNKGVLNKLTISHGDLNKIAALGGADFFETKTFKWTVLASKGTNVVKAAQDRTISLERPAGFAEIPGTVYMYGSATEVGDDIANAMPLHQVAPGVFEIYSMLKSGTFKLVDAKTGTPNTYNIYEDAGAIKLGVDAETTYTGPDNAIMRVRIDFNNVNASYMQIKEMKLWYAQAQDFWFTLPYAGKGVWRKNGYDVNYIEVGWGLEDRYKYMMIVDRGNGDEEYWINYSNSDSPGQDGQYPQPIEYKKLNLETNNNSQYDWTWKFDRTYLTQGSNADFWISFDASQPEYYQDYKKN